MHEVQRPPLRPNRYVAPATIPEALALLAADPGAAGRTRVVAGGTDLMIELDHQVGGEVGALVDITRIPELDRIELRDGRVVLGPLVTHNQCATSEVIVEHGLPLAQASLEVGSPALRNRATVVGNLVTASPANDTISALRALDADLTLTSTRGSRTVPLADFHTGVRATVLDPDELVTEVSFPMADLADRAVFVKLGLRRAQAISVVHLAAWCSLGSDGTVADARLALGSVAPTIVRVGDAEASLVGRELTGEAIEDAAGLAAASVEPIDDIRGPAGYRRDMVAVMVRRALRALATGEHRATHPASPPTLGGPVVAADGVGTDAGPGQTIRTTVNGQDTEGPWTPTSLLDWLRDQAGLTGTKEGCAEGECGSCTIHLEGVATLSCLIPAGRAHGAAVTTIEGLAGPHQLHPLQQGFVDSAAVQCGYCIPGFLMAGASLQAERPHPSPEDIHLALSGNLCRCTGYYSIEAAFGGSGS